MCARELDVPEAMEKVIRVLLLVNSDDPAFENQAPVPRGHAEAAARPGAERTQRSQVMIIVMKSAATMKEVSSVLKQIEAHGFKPHMSKGEETTVIGVIGDERKVDAANFQTLPGRREGHPRPQALQAGEPRLPEEGHGRSRWATTSKIGGGTFTVMAGPCAVETAEQTMECARKVVKSGARVLRGGAFKPRTSPYAFQGLGREGLEILALARKETGLPSSPRS
jgi:3-deoxy-7-phosphoheptulonate synthase